VVSFLNDYFAIMGNEIIACGGHIDKFIGDAVFAHWGAVESAGNPQEDALAAIRSSLLIRASLASFNVTRGSKRRPIIKTGMGINSGRVVAGQIGSDERLEFTIIGEAVNLASRTETFNKAFGTELLITENTWKLAGEKFICEEMPSITEKGAKLRLFAVVNTADEEEAKTLLDILDNMEGTDPEISRTLIGKSGPQTLSQLRALLRLPEPDLSQVDTDEEEKKYRLASPSALPKSAEQKSKQERRWKGIERVEKAKRQMGGKWKGIERVEKAKRQLSAYGQAAGQDGGKGGGT